MFLNLVLKFILYIVIRYRLGFYLGLYFWFNYDVEDIFFFFMLFLI